MSQHNEPGNVPQEDEQFFRFLESEGLELLASFRRIGDFKKRQLVMALTAALAEAYPPKMLDDGY